MKRVTCIVVLVLGTCVAFAQNRQSKDLDAVRIVLQQQERSWNEGNIEGFMQGYWHHDSLTFIGKKGVTKGWQATFDNYKKSYPDKTMMGRLQFDIVSMESLSHNTVLVIGKWDLSRENNIGNLGGYFTLIFRKINRQWVIVSDHTS